MKSSGFMVSQCFRTISGGGGWSCLLASFIQLSRCSFSLLLISTPSRSKTHPNQEVESIIWRTSGLASVGSSATPTGGK